MTSTQATTTSGSADAQVSGSTASGNVDGGAQAGQVNDPTTTVEKTSNSGATLTVSR